MEKKNILVIGGGGREHAICFKLKESREVGKIYALPGNAGIAEIAECHDIKATDIPKILEFVDAHSDIYLTVVAPDDPLAAGLVNELEKRGLKAFGPVKEAAVIEASKIFSKNFMKRYNIPTAAYEVFEDYESAAKYIEKCSYPIVLKADGLALGKGVIICNSVLEANDGLSGLMLEQSYGAAGKKVVIEEFLNGFEVSLLTFTDGTTVYPMLPSRDHKRALDNDEGLNTGGMGAYCPVPEFTAQMMAEALDKIVVPTVNGLKNEGRIFKGVLYFGLMVTANGIKVLEYNARFGDPETQAVLPLLKTDLFKIFDAIADGRLSDINIEWSDEACVCVVAASGGYPLGYEKNKRIKLFENAKKPDDVLIFHAGTAALGDKLVTSGGRVLGVTAKGESLPKARAKAYQAIKDVEFEGMFYRNDICGKYQ